MKTPRTSGSAAPVDQSRLTVSCRHAADPSLTDKDGKQDTEEDDDEHNELHGYMPGSVVKTAAGSLCLRADCEAKI
jgi:hypothetical protein